MKNAHLILLACGWICIAGGCATTARSIVPRALGVRKESGHLIIAALEMAHLAMHDLKRSSDGSVELARTNLVTNSSFKWNVFGTRAIYDGLAAGWSVWGKGYGAYSPHSVPSLPECGPGGTRCQQILVSDEGMQTLSFGQSIAGIKGGRPYTFTADVRVAPAPGAAASVAIDFYHGKRWIAARRGRWHAPSTFTRLSVTAAAPANADRAVSVILFRPTRPNSRETLQVDAAQLQASSTVRPYEGEYGRSGEISSNPIDLARRGRPYELSWVASEPAATRVSLQLRFAPTAAGLAHAPWLGPSGEAAYSDRATIGPNLIAEGQARPIGWGRNDRRFGRSTTARKLEVSMNRYSSGDARWQVPTKGQLLPGTEYAFSVRHRESSSRTRVRLFVTFEDAKGAMQWGAGGSEIVTASTVWRTDKIRFRTPPGGAVRAWVQIALDGAGSIESRSYRVRRVEDSTQWAIDAGTAADRFLQWRALLRSRDLQVTPRLYDVEIRYGAPRPEIVWPNVLSSDGTTQTYRFAPGRTALFAPLVRDFTGAANLRNVTLTLTDPAGRLRLKQRLKRARAIGSEEAQYAYRYTFSSRAPLGDWMAEITAHDRFGGSRSATVVLKLAEPYRAAPQRMLLGALATDYGFSRYTGAGLAQDIAAYRRFPGLQIWKVSLSWKLLEPRPGDYNRTMISGLRTFIAAAHAAGAKAEVGIEQQNFPDWVNNGSWDNPNRYRFDQTRRLARTWAFLASAIKGSPGLGSYLIINEEDFVESANAYLRSVERVISAIRRVDPNPAHRITIRPNTRNPYVRTMIAENGAQDFDYGNGGYPTSPAWYLKKYVSPTSITADLRLASFHESPLVFGAPGGIGEVGFFSLPGQKGFGDRQKLLGFERAMTIAYEMGDDEFLMWSGAFGFADPSVYFPKLVAFRNRLVGRPRPARFDVRLVMGSGTALYRENRPQTSGLDLRDQPVLAALRYLDEHGYVWYYTTSQAMQIQHASAAATIDLSELKGKSAEAQAAFLRAKLRNVAPSGLPLPWPGR